MSAQSQALLVGGRRTPVGKYGGALSSVRPDDLAALTVKAVVEDAGIDPSVVDDVILGNANGAGEENRNVARMSLLLAGLPETVPGVTLNRLCASGLDAVGAAARAIRSGDIALALAGGRAVVDAAARGTSATVWIPRRLAVLAAIMRVVPRPVWRHMPR